MKISVAATLPSEPAPVKDAKPEETSKSDAAFQARQKTLADKLARERQSENWVYSVPAEVVDPLIKPRAGLMAKARTDAETNAPAATEK